MSRLKSRLLHYAMNDPLFVTERTALVALSQGRVLEICFETEKNVHYYSPWVSDLTIVSFQGSSGDNLPVTNDRVLPVKRFFSVAENERFPFEDCSFDFVVSTLTLCRTTASDTILRELRRVLKPSGAYLFLEHGRSADPSMSLWQRRLRNLWLKYGGCDIHREIDRMITAAGFRFEKLDRFQLGQPKFLSTMYRGIARCA